MSNTEKKRINEVGNTYSRLRVLEFSHIDRHRNAHWTVYCDPTLGCSAGGKKFTTAGRLLRREETQSCGCLREEILSKQVGENHPGWKGGRKTDSNGYILIHQPEHPCADMHGYAREHRLVCERVHKRYLGPEEVVHHINGIRDDNRPENLWIFESEVDHQAFHRWQKKQAELDS